MLLDSYWEVQIDVQYTRVIHEVHQPTPREAEPPRPHRDEQEHDYQHLVLSDT